MVGTIVFWLRGILDRCVKEPPVLCPHCAATTTIEQPRRTALGYRTFRCPACRRSSNERTGTP